MEVEQEQEQPTFRTFFSALQRRPFKIFRILFSRVGGGRGRRKFGRGRNVLGPGGGNGFSVPEAPAFFFSFFFFFFFFFLLLSIPVVGFLTTRAPWKVCVGELFGFVRGGEFVRFWERRYVASRWTARDRIEAPL